MDQLKFPSDPLIDQVYSLNGKAWLWNGKRWTPIYKRVIGDQDSPPLPVKEDQPQL